MAYLRIAPLPAGFTDAEAASVESLRDAWTEQKGGLSASGTLGEFNERLIRRWSIETGIVERLYSLDRATTDILVAKGLNAALIEHGASDLPAAELVTILQDHKSAAEYVVDHVAKGQPLTAHFIRSVHSLLTRSQEFVDTQDQFGKPVRTPLLKGEFKQLADNPRRPDGIVHEYCPPTLVTDEIESLLRSYEQMDAERAPSVVQAAWLHHRFTQIHPFQDGNGRVARALTALILIKHECFPIVVDRDNRERYIDSLEAADAGDLRPLIRLFAMLEKQELEQALSLSEGVLTTPVAPDQSIRAKLLGALRDRARDRRLAITAKRREVLAKGERVFKTVTVPLVHGLGAELKALLDAELPGSDVRVEVSDPAKRHFFKTQIVQIARSEHYYGDFETAHEWVRLRVQRPGHSDDAALSEVVISMHSLGRQFTGVLVMSAYFATRFLDENNRSVTLQPHLLADRSLTFSYLEQQENIAGRVRDWTNGVLDMGLVHLQSSL